MKLLMEAGEDDEAEAALHEALERHPDDAGLHFQLESAVAATAASGGSPGRPLGARSRSTRRSPTGTSIW